MKRSKIKAIEETINKIQAFLSGGEFEFGHFNTCPLCIEAGVTLRLHPCDDCALIDLFGRSCMWWKPTGMTRDFDSLFGNAYRSARVKFMEAALRDIVQFLDNLGYEVVDKQEGK